MKPSHCFAPTEQNRVSHTEHAEPFVIQEEVFDRRPDELTHRFAENSCVLSSWPALAGTHCSSCFSAVNWKHSPHSIRCELAWAFCTQMYKRSLVPFSGRETRSREGSELIIFQLGDSWIRTSTPSSDHALSSWEIFPYAQHWCLCIHLGFVLLVDSISFPFPCIEESVQDI